MKHLFAHNLVSIYSQFAKSTDAQLMVLDQCRLKVLPQLAHTGGLRNLHVGMELRLDAGVERSETADTGSTPVSVWRPEGLLGFMPREQSKRVRQMIDDLLPVMGVIVRIDSTNLRHPVEIIVAVPYHPDDADRPVLN